MTMATTTTTRTMTMTTTMTMAMTMATAPMKTMTMTMTTKMTIAFSQVLLDYADCGNHAEKIDMVYNAGYAVQTCPKMELKDFQMAHLRTCLARHSRHACKRCKRLQYYPVRASHPHSFALTLEWG